MTVVVAIRDLTIVIVGIVLFEFVLDYRLPEERVLLLYFVAIPIIWTTIGQIWLSYSYADLQGWWMKTLSHVLTVCMLASSVFLVSIVLNTIHETLDGFGSVMFHLVGWTALLAMVFHDVVDTDRSNRRR